MKILIVEDEVSLAEIERDYLQTEGYEVFLSHDGSQALDMFQTLAPDVVILDIMLPGKDGMTICREIRHQSQAGIIMTTARVEEIDRLLGLELGADDYLCKPFSPRELVARVKALARRLNTSTENTAPKLTLDGDRLLVHYESQQLELTRVEFELLSQLTTKPGKILSRNHLMDHIYPDGRIVSDRTIDSHIKKLRQKLQKLAPDQEFIHSVYGAGYKYEQI